MYEWFEGRDPIIQAVIATCFTWFVTALGASVVFLFKNISRVFLDMMLGFASGVMIAASFWSLLAPAISMAEDEGKVPSWLPALIGFVLGGMFIYVINQVIPHIHLGMKKDKYEGIKTKWRRSVLLVLAITLHNIPEGLAVGVSFGALAYDLPSASLGGAIALAIGIGMQNFPEGVSVSVPLRREGMSRSRSFWYGQMSGIVEPIAGFIGAAAVMFIKPLLPYALSFAAGAMIFVVVEELIPESQLEKHKNLATIGAIIGFAVMMTLDVALG
ncbi:MAG: ZIP family metal transporter [Cyclobacteriaceae bacterium]